MIFKQKKIVVQLESWQYCSILLLVEYLQLQRKTFSAERMGCLVDPIKLFVDIWVAPNKDK